MLVLRATRRRFATTLLFGVLSVVLANVARAQWIQANGPKDGSMWSLLAVPGANGTSLYAGQTRVWRTTDTGATWTHLSSGLADPNALALLAVPEGSGHSVRVTVGVNVRVSEPAVSHVEPYIAVTGSPDVGWWASFCAVPRLAPLARVGSGRREPSTP